MNPKKRNFLIGLGALLAFVIVREVVFRSPQAAVSRLADYNIVARRDTVREIFFRDKTLVYDVIYASVVPLGRLTITTRHNAKVCSLRARVSTQGTPLGTVLKARAEIASLLDPQTLAPRQYREYTEVKGKKKTKVFLFDLEEMVVRQGERTVKIEEGVRDVLSAFFLLLSRTPSAELLQATFISKKELYTITLTPLQQKTLVAAYQVDIRRADGTSTHGGRFTVWIAKNATRTPVLFKSWTPAGHMSVLLREIRSDEEEEATP